jgi:probable rRNA maturation factor
MNNPSIQFNFLESISLTDRKRLKRFLVSLFKREKKPLAGLQYIFCSDPYLLEINRQFLQHDFYTDIITFELADRDQPIQGEIYISVDRVRDNAEIFASTINRELHRVIFHGALHLCGYNDKTENEQKKMRKMEEWALVSYLK